MTIEIYNSLTRKKEPFIPIEEGKVKMYVCGPTVYNYIHIGNARSTVAFDTIRRYLEYRGYQVNYVSNFTDVDDKIIKAAQEENLTTKEVADKYIAAFHEDTSQINVKKATTHPRVIDHIQEIIDFVQSLIEQDYAYVSEGDVYFRTAAFDKYGELSGQSIEELREGASQRLDEEELARKENPIDFALWKTAKDGEISWDSPWGKGRPGWHIECSVMSMKYLGNNLDIHGGGQDLAFPHHENEIAQSEGHSHEVFANYWMHNGFVTFGGDGEKMSKSLGNFILLRDLLKETDPMVVRYLLGTVHYRRPLRYDVDALNNAKTNIQKIKEVLRRLKIRIKKTSSQTIEDTEISSLLSDYEARFQDAMDDDFNAANGMTVIFELIKYINHQLEQENVSQTTLNLLQDKLVNWLDIFGLIFGLDEEIDTDIEALIEERNQARSNRDFQRADEIRDHLRESGILLDDTPQGTTWKRVE
ncbi:cysteine--tRNA ligase [Aerococcaceae bacterium DSM 111020]|nr:cysteine--tRNA ligase [Aerococcaceae bacterium DSM 111020]